ncbi:armadillo repeat-containing protein 3 isoform X4 [Mastacembelus armatus]|uniref:armadillo repeat-containing protein 3 isoform X4 n=1 Tax=Mastacembelus armatus TaxID=205130 RepID=UPI000E45F2DC|nr:armadillo repeat-containing protein 3 isoform X4 [Mastacembelus armatus]
MGKKAKKESETPCKDMFEAVPVVCKTPATLVLLLSSPEEDILIKTCEAIHTFAEKGDENKVCLLRLEALKPLCQLISHNNKLVSRNAFMALGIMATSGDVKSALKKINVIPLIINKLLEVQDDAVVHEFATLCLASLSVDFTCKVQIFANKGLPPIIQLLSCPDPDVKKNSLEIIFNLVQDFSDLHAEALQVVTNCLCDDECIQLIHKGGGLTKLMDFFLTPNMPEIKSGALKCITMVAQNSENCKLLHEQNVEKILVELLCVADTGVKASTCQAVAAMSLHESSNNRFRDLGGIPALVEGLNSESLVLREAATQALSNLTHSNKLSAFAVYEAEGHKILVQQLYGNCPKTIANAAATLGNMARHEVIRCSILSHGAIQALVEPLKSTDTQILVSTTLCLAMLACDAEARTQLRSAGGLHPLVSLLESNHKEVLHNACLAVNVCASDKSTAMEMFRFGVLEILQEINQSVNRRSSFSELAMINLINSNLSVKYSLTGHLASTDIICDGFYDAGKARAGQKIVTLEELSMQPVNRHQPIIVVHTTIEKKNEDKHKDETQAESHTEKPWKMMDDDSLHVLVKEAKKSILPLKEQEQYAALARLVSEAMGGAVEIENLHQFPWVLHLKKLKHQLQSNVIPIGLIKNGIYCHRALLFKCLADCIGISCTLVRGEYNRAWNEVLLFSENLSSNGCSSQPCNYIVDLMHEPGNLLAVNTTAAVQYQTILTNNVV